MDAAQQEFGVTRLAELLVAQKDKALGDIITEVTGTVRKVDSRPRRPG